MDKRLPPDGDFFALELMSSTSARKTRVQTGRGRRPSIVQTKSLMPDSTYERRRETRVSLAPECRIPLGVPSSAQVMELSSSGALLASKTELAVGDRGELIATVGHRTLRIAIEIRTVSLETRARGGTRYRVGAMFVDVTIEQRVLLSQLLGAGPD